MAAEVRLGLCRRMGRKRNPPRMWIERGGVAWGILLVLHPGDEGEEGGQEGGQEVVGSST